VHRAAIYLDLHDPGNLLVVAIDDVGGVPGGLLVDRVTDLRRIGVQPGMMFVPTAAGWAIPSAGVGIDPSRAITWSAALPPAALLELTPDLARTVAVARRLAADGAPKGGLVPLLADPLAPHPGSDGWLVRAWVLIDRQRHALVAGDVVAALGPTADLIGLGVGLTPSGDDYLVGLLAGLAATGDPVVIELGAAIAALAPARTTTVGASAIAHAARGEFAERLRDVLIALARGRFADLATSIERATAYGATSGSDTLVGLFEGIDVALARRARRLSVAA
jgi:Protein of unknown function (DUF2877)